MIHKDGHITAIAQRDRPDWPSLLFREDQFRGPAWVYRGKTVAMTRTGDDALCFEGKVDAVRFRMRYDLAGSTVRIHASIKNLASDRITGIQAGVRLGIDTSMETYPSWNDKLFPTLLRCEKTHFWGCLMGPRGQILLVTVPSAVASYHLHYKPELHRIFTVSLDLMNPPPLPDRHPRDLDRLEPGEEKGWDIDLRPLTDLSQVKPEAARLLDAPMLEAELYTVGPGETFRGRIFCGRSPLKSLTVRRPDGSICALATETTGAGVYRFSFSPDGRAGIYQVIAVAENGKASEANLALRRPWSWYLLEARRNAVIQEQKGGSHVESWYGFFSAYLARKHFPDRQLDQAIDAKFNEVWPIMYDPIAMKPSSTEDRIQNHACAAGLFVDRYQASGDIKDMEWAASLADFLTATQGEDGGYYSGYRDEEHKGTHYTAVIYIAKSMMEVIEQELELGKTRPAWQRTGW